MNRNELYHYGTPQDGGRPGSGAYEEGTGKRPWQHQDPPSGYKAKKVAKKALKATGKAAKRTSKAAGRALKRVGKGTANVGRNLIDSLVARGIAPTFLMSDASIKRGMERGKLKTEYTKAVIENKTAKKKMKKLAKKELKKLDQEDLEVGKTITKTVLEKVIAPVGAGIALNMISNTISRSGMSEESKNNILKFVGQSSGSGKNRGGGGNNGGGNGKQRNRNDTDNTNTTTNTNTNTNTTGQTEEDIRRLQRRRFQRGG